MAVLTLLDTADTTAQTIILSHHAEGEEREGTRKSIHKTLRAFETGNTAECIKLAKLRLFFFLKSLEGHNYG